MLYVFWISVGSGCIVPVKINMFAAGSSCEMGKLFVCRFWSKMARCERVEYRTGIRGLRNILKKSFVAASFLGWKGGVSSVVYVVPPHAGITTVCQLGEALNVQGRSPGIVKHVTRQVRSGVGGTSTGEAVNTTKASCPQSSNIGRAGVSLCILYPGVSRCVPVGPFFFLRLNPPQFSIVFHV